MRLPVLVLLLLLIGVPVFAQETEEAPPAEVVTDAPVEGIATDAPPTEVVPTEAVPTEAAPIDVIPTEVAPTEAMPTEALPTEAAPTDVPPTEAAPTEAPVEVVPTEAPVVTEVPVEVTPVPTENRVIVTPDVVATDAPEAPQVAQTFVVNSLGDQGDAVSDGQCDTVNGAPFTCTLRAAIDEANATTDADTIRFNIPGPGAKEIILGSTLTITNPVTIDGRTQPGYPAVPPPFTTPLIGIDGPGGL
jgi:CSLREA domain-containing protein